LNVLAQDDEIAIVAQIVRERPQLLRQRLHLLQPSPLGASSRDTTGL
jgi:hypothetical protein